MSDETMETTTTETASTQETAAVETAPTPETAPVETATAPEAAPETHACPDCDRTYTAKSNLLRHRKTAHGYVGPRSKVDDTAPQADESPAPAASEPVETPKLVVTRKAQSTAAAEKGRAEGKAGLARKIKTADVLDAFILRPFLPPELATWEREMLEQGGVDQVEIPQIVYLAALTLAIVVPRAQAAFSRYKETKQKAQLDASQHAARKAQLDAQVLAEREAAKAKQAAMEASAAQKPVDSTPEAGQTEPRKTPNIRPQFEA